MRSYFLHMLAFVVFLPLTAGCQGKDGKNDFSFWRDKKKSRDDAKVEDAPKIRISSKTHLASARMLERQNDLVGAIQQYEEAIKTDPNLTEAYNRLGMIYLRLSRFKEAEKTFKRGIEVQPTSAPIRNNLGFCYLKQKRHKRAEEEFRLALTMSPEYKRARMNLGVVLARTNRLGASAIEFARVLPKEVAFYNVAVICMDMKRYKNAEEALNRSLRVNPNYEPAKTQLARLDGLREPESSIAKSSRDRKSHTRQKKKSIKHMTPLVGHSSDASSEQAP